MTRRRPDDPVPVTPANMADLARALRTAAAAGGGVIDLDASAMIAMARALDIDASTSRSLAKLHASERRVLAARDEVIAANEALLQNIAALEDARRDRRRAIRLLAAGIVTLILVAVALW